MPFVSVNVGYMTKSLCEVGLDGLIPFSLDLWLRVPI